MIKKKHKFSRKEQESLVKEGKKGCSDCGEILPLDCFGKQNSKMGYRPFCRYCRHVKQMKRNGKSPRSKEDFWHRHGLREDGFIDKSGKYRNHERDRVNFIQRVYKVDFQESLDLYKRSIETNCEICGKSPEENGRALAVDHCHNTGKVRGLLCDPCNKGLGHFNDNLDVIKRALKYLKER